MIELGSPLPIKMSIHWITKVTLLCGTLFFLSLALLSFFYTHQVLIAVCYVLFTLLGIYTFITSLAIIEINQESIKVISPPHGVYRMYWQDVKYVETNGKAYAFFGDNKCLMISLAYVRNGKREFNIFFGNFTQERQVDVRPLSSVWLRQKNTKVKGTI